MRASDVSDAQEHKHTNELIRETSPYLLQHAHNPVNWHAWNPETLAQAQKEDKPIFLSVGYSTCYWCHVMEKDSFEDEEVAKALNKDFIAIKVDREERPDIDEQYMLATQLVTGRGGWPNSLWLMPDGRPFMAGTYFPKAQFLQVLETIARVWKEKRREVEQQAGELARAIRQTEGARGLLQPGPDAGPADQKLVDNAVAEYTNMFDAEHGGFGMAPKFPPHGVLSVLIHEYRRTEDKALLRMVTRTLDAIWLGGIHDHLGGGFHRYSTDSVWLLPHFEKMLYDNAQLMRAYTDGYALSGVPRYREAVEDIFRWVQNEMTAPQGGFYSALDSGEVGKEGEAYVWRYKEAVEALGTGDAALFAEVYNLKEKGNFSEEATGEQPGSNIIHLKRPLADIATARGESPELFQARMAALRAKLLARRQTRAQ
ncbi:MAG: thioredoxin domain-containing protein, partial [Planctomycetota bacterium]